MNIEKKHVLITTPDLTMVVIPETLLASSGFIKVALLDHEGNQVRQITTVFHPNMSWNQQGVARNFIQDITLALCEETIAIRQNARLWNALVRLAAANPNTGINNEEDGYDPNHLGLVHEQILHAVLFDDGDDESRQETRFRRSIGTLAARRFFLQGEFKTEYLLTIQNNDYTGRGGCEVYSHPVYHSAWEPRALIDDVEAVRWLLSHPALTKHTGNFRLPQTDVDSPLVSYTEEERLLLLSILNDKPLPKKRASGKKAPTK